MTLLSQTPKIKKIETIKLPNSDTQVTVRIGQISCNYTKLPKVTIMPPHQYKIGLDKTSRKFICPNCGKKRFVRFYDFETKSYLAEEFGRCDREFTCGYFLRPSAKNTIIKNHSIAKNKMTKPSYHSFKLVEKSIEKENNFTLFLEQKFGKASLKIKQKYMIGTSSWNDGVIFWQIDKKLKVRAGKIVVYKKNGRRTNKVNWVHSIQKKNKVIEKFNLQQCLFGEHLLRGNKLPIAIVESEKTACIMKIIFPDLNWLASGSCNGLKYEKIMRLSTREIILYPDLAGEKSKISPFEIWSEKAERYNAMGLKVSVSDLLEKKATDEQKELGCDIADYFS